MTDAPTRKSPWSLVLVCTGGLAALALVFYDGSDSRTEEPSTSRDPMANPGPDPAPKAGSGGTSSGGTGVQRVDVDTYSDLITLSRSDRQAFDERVAAAIRSEIAHVRLAAYRAMLQVDRRRATQSLIEVLGHPGIDARLRGFAFEVVEPLAEHRQDARTALIRLLAVGCDDPTQRGAAFAGVPRYGQADEVKRCLPSLHAETEADVVVQAARGLSASMNATSRQQAAALHWQHPDPAVRKRLRALRIGK